MCVTAIFPLLIETRIRSINIAAIQAHIAYIRSENILPEKLPGNLVVVV